MDGIVAPPLAGYKAVDPALEVIVTSTTGDLSWLSAWKDQLNGAKVLVAHDASVTVSGPPQGIQVELVPKRADVPKLSARDLAVLAAKAPWILFLAEGTSPATAPDGQVVQVLKEHITNLNTPATPFFFNTLYDPFRAGADFVRGYPFSLRDGVKTVVSHGLSLGQPDLDAATLLAKPLSRNDRYVDATLTVPKESLALFSARNLAVDKSRIGIALYSGLDSDNIWTSLTLKALSNHLGYGCKTGLPYVTTSKPTASQAPADLQALAKFQEQVIAFFQQIQLTQGTTAEQAYLELAGKVKQQLGAVDPYFIQVADGMEAWSTAYKQ